MAKHKETVWIIVGKFGRSYAGCSTSRRAMIAEHVNALDEICYREQRSGVYGLSVFQKAAWKRCHKNGDRAIKATLIWDGASNKEGGKS